MTLAVSTALPAAAVLAHAPLADDGGHDDAIVAALGLGASGGFSLHGLVAAPFVLLPVGTLVFRLALVSALATGFAGAAVHTITLRVTRTWAERTAARVPAWLLACIAMIGALAATLSPIWQLEATAPLSSTLLAAALLGAIAVAMREERVSRATWHALGAFALTSVAFWLARRYHALYTYSAASDFGLRVVAFDLTRVRSFLRDEVGLVTSCAAAAGVVRVIVRAPRTWGITLALVAAGCALAAGFDARQLGPEHFGAAALALVALVRTFAAVATAALVSWVSGLKVPLASASASMVALLAAAVPAMVFDETSLAHEARSTFERVDWGETTLGGVTPGTLYLSEDARVSKRFVAAALVGDAPETLALVPVHDVGSRLMRAELARVPELVPLLRDITLSGLPTELSMSKLAETKPVALTFSKRWDRPLARHLLPEGAVDRFEPEPRGAPERKKKLEAADAAFVSLARALRNANAIDLAESTALVLGGRVNALNATGERDNATLAGSHVASFAPAPEESHSAGTASITRRAGAGAVGATRRASIGAKAAR